MQHMQKMQKMQDPTCIACPDMQEMQNTRYFTCIACLCMQKCNKVRIPHVLHVYARLHGLHASCSKPFSDRIRRALLLKCWC